MYESVNKYSNLQDRLPWIGKWVKKVYMERYGVEPQALPHKMKTPSGSTVNTRFYYYEDSFLKELFKVN